MCFYNLFFPKIFQYKSWDFVLKTRRDKTRHGPGAWLWGRKRTFGCLTCVRPLVDSCPAKLSPAYLVDSWVFQYERHTVEDTYLNVLESSSALAAVRDMAPVCVHCACPWFGLRPAAWGWGRGWGWKGQQRRLEDRLAGGCWSGGREDGPSFQFLQLAPGVQLATVLGSCGPRLQNISNSIASN